MEHPKAVGDKSQLAVMYALGASGYELLLPFGENTRYDLVIHDGASFGRVQCKTGRLRQGAVVFHTASSYGHHPNPKIVKRDYIGEVEFFGVLCLETGGVYLVPIADVPTSGTASLRVDPPKNGQVRRIRYARDYEIGRVRAG
jgi:PD-(D/E)XK endonuclease